MKYLSTLLDGHAAKESQLNQASLVWIEYGELLQRFIESENVDGSFLKGDRKVIDRQVRSPLTSLFGPLGLCMVNQDSTHDDGRRRNEVLDVFEACTR